MRGVVHVLAGAAVAASLATAAGAQPAVQRSGGVYHVAACADRAGPYAHCHALVVTDKAGRPLASAAPKINGFVPDDLRDAYNITSSGSASTIVAAIDAFGYPNAEADLGVYRAQFGLPPCTTANGCFKKLNQDGQEGPYPPFDLGWALQSAADLDMLSAMCPNCQIVLMEANTNSVQDLATTVNVAADQGAHVISNGYGSSESGTQTFEPDYNHPGVAVTASAGDNGFAGGPLFPASSQHVIAVGGTHLERVPNKRGWRERVWSGGGSGCSAVYPKPSWQNDPGCTKRTIADTAAVSDPATGVAVYGPKNSMSSTWLVLGGTSVATPLIGGVYGNNGGKVTYAKRLYKAFDAIGGKHCPKSCGTNDIVSGGNGTCEPAYLCTGEQGYDGPSGNGTPDGTRLY